MIKEMVKVGVANTGETNLEIEVVKTWVPKNITYLGGSAVFKYEKTFYSMKVEDFKRIFNL
mgnify:CR=1 FL=1